MQLKSTRKDDKKQENILNQFLFENFFTKMNPTARLVDDVDLQVAGVDVQQENQKGTTVNIDIKAQSSPKYINNPRPTFVLELSFLNKYEEPFVGWFLNPDLITDYYTFVWVHDADVDENGRLRSKNDIHKVEVMTVAKERLKTYVLSLLKNENLDDIIDDMRDTEETHRHIARGIHFSHTPTLYEKPVNIVAHKNVLKKFAVVHRMVTKDGMTTIRN